MTPKEKAIELVDKFYQTTPNEAFYNPPIGSITSDKYSAWEQSKQCALIAVDEVIKATIDDWSHYEYWQEVKTELEKL
jgi:hypothetical protein